MKSTKLEKVLLVLSTVSAVISIVKIVSIFINKASKETDEVLYVEDEDGNYIYQDLCYPNELSVS